MLPEWMFELNSLYDVYDRTGVVSYPAWTGVFTRLPPTP